MSAVWAVEGVTTLRNIRNHSPSGAASRPIRRSPQQLTCWGLPFAVCRNVGFQMYSANGFLGFPVSSRTCSDASQHSKLIMSASHSAVAVWIYCSWSPFSRHHQKIGDRYYYHCTLILSSICYKYLKHYVITDRVA